MTNPRLNSVHQDTFILLATVGDNLTFVVIFTGRGGLFGSTFGLFVGMGFCLYLRKINSFHFHKSSSAIWGSLTGNGHNLLLTLTITLGGK